MRNYFRTVQYLEGEEKDEMGRGVQNNSLGKHNRSKYLLVSVSKLSRVIDTRSNLGTLFHHWINRAFSLFLSPLIRVRVKVSLFIYSLGIVACQ